MITGFLSQERENNRQWQNLGDAYSSKIKALLLSGIKALLLSGIKALLLSGIKALLQTLEEIILLYTIVHFTALSNHLKIVKFSGTRTRKISWAKREKKNRMKVGF